MQISTAAVFEKLMEISSTIGTMSITMVSLERRVGALEDKIDRRFRSDPPSSWSKTDTGSHYIVKAEEAERIRFDRLEERGAAKKWVGFVNLLAKVAAPVLAAVVTYLLVRSR